MKVIDKKTFGLLRAAVLRRLAQEHERNGFAVFLDGIRPLELLAKLVKAPAPFAGIAPRDRPAAAGFFWQTLVRQGVVCHNQWAGRSEYYLPHSIPHLGFTAPSLIERIGGLA